MPPATRFQPNRRGYGGGPADQAKSWRPQTRGYGGGPADQAKSWRPQTAPTNAAVVGGEGGQTGQPKREANPFGDAKPINLRDPCIERVPGGDQRGGGWNGAAGRGQRRWTDSRPSHSRGHGGGPADRAESWRWPSGNDQKRVSFSQEVECFCISRVCGFFVEKKILFVCGDWGRRN
eukprot:Selendium_serpulae@DN1117_c0_g1_i2.p2